MLNYDTTTITIVLAVFFSIAAFAVTAALATLGGLVVTHRRAAQERRRRIGTTADRRPSAPAGRPGGRAHGLA